MIYLFVYLILHFLSSIYLLTQCGGKKKNDQNKDKKGATPTPAPPAAPAKPAEEKSKPAAEEKKDEGKQEASKPADTKSAEKPKDDKKKEEAEKKEGEDKKQEELKLDPTPPSGDDEKKEPPKEPAASKSTMGKPDDQIKLSASSLVWEDKEAQQVLKVTNNSEKKQALKIKCSNNETFKVNPVFAMIEPSKTLDVVVTRKNGPLKSEKLLILTTPYDGADAEKAYEDKELIPACAPIPLVPKS